MSRNNTQARTRQPAPSPQPNQKAAGQKVDKADTHNASDDAETMGVTGNLSGGAAALIANASVPKRTNNLFLMQAANISQQARRKIELMGDVRQRLAEASDLFAEGDDRREEATEVAAKAALGLYQARISGTISADEVSAALGDAFGWKKLKDGSPSKTPLGQGEAIRKRVVRAVSAAEYVSNGDGGRFFEGLPEKEVDNVLTLMQNGEMGFWAAYERFAEIKRENAIKTNPAYDPKKVAAFVESLSQDGAGDVIRNNPALIASYAALLDVLVTLGEEPAETEE